MLTRVLALIMKTENNTEKCVLGKKNVFLRKVFKKAAKTFEARDFLNMFLRFVCSFSNETFSYKKDL